MKLTDIFIGLGSNLGDRLENLTTAVAALAKFMHIEAFSPIYETAPLYFSDQPAFLNMVVRGQTPGSVRQILLLLQEQEVAMGRRKTRQNGPRLIDLDILYFGQQRYDAADLKIPHIGIAERRFVLEPVHDIAPQWFDCRRQKTIAQMRDELGPAQEIRQFGPWPSQPSLVFSPS